MKPTAIDYEKYYSKHCATSKFYLQFLLRLFLLIINPKIALHMPVVRVFVDSSQLGSTG